MLFAAICWVLLCQANLMAARSLRQVADPRHFRYMWHSEPNIEIVTQYWPGHFGPGGFNMTKLYDASSSMHEPDSQSDSEDLYAQILSHLQLDAEATPTFVHFDALKNLTTPHQHEPMPPHSQHSYEPSHHESSTPLRAVLQNVRKWFSYEPRPKFHFNGVPVGRAQATLPEGLEEYASIKMLSGDSLQLPMRHIAFLAPDSDRIIVRGLQNAAGELQWLQLSKAPMAWQLDAVNGGNFDETMDSSQLGSGQRMG